MMQEEPLYSHPILFQTEGLIPQASWGIIFTSQSIPHGEHDGHIQSFISLILYIPHKDSHREAAVLGTKDWTQAQRTYVWLQLSGPVMGTESLLKDSPVYSLCSLHLPYSQGDGLPEDLEG